MIVADLSPAEFRHKLRQSGLRIRVGPIVAEVRSRFDVVESAIGLHYGAHELVGRDEFADFHVSVEAPPGLRRWLKPQAIFCFDGDPPFKPLDATQAFAVLEWGLNWCVASHCHQYLVIHAAVIERRGRALILPAPPGSGKSTLCAALVARGWRLLSDELTLVDVASGNIVPLPRPISLKNQSIASISEFWQQSIMSPVIHETLKGSVTHVRPPVESVRCAAEMARPGWIAIPRYRQSHRTELVALSKAAAFMQLVDNAFNYGVHGQRGFEVLADVTAASECFEFTYGGALDEAVEAFDALAARS